MSFDVLCLRPEVDFTRAGVTPPAGLTIAYRRSDDFELAALIKGVRALPMLINGPYVEPMNNVSGRLKFNVIPPSDIGLALFSG